MKANGLLRVRRLDEAHSRDVVLFLRGLRKHPEYVAPPALLDGVRAFLVSRLPTGRVPPEALEG